jgi:hypothetical protein
MVHIFFMAVCGGMRTRGEWRELVQRGLLSRPEADQLRVYPVRSIETVLVLATWAMQIVDKALEDDAFWEFRSMRIAHTHNRLQTHMNGILRSIHDIGDILALPIPFPYYHIMNVVIVFNLLMLTVITASFSTYQTIFPFSVSLMFFLGLREVSSSLADPFDGEDCDFPIATFLQYSFDTSICLLEAFRSGTPDHFVAGLLDQTVEFTNEQLRHVMPAEVLYTPSYDPTIGSPFSWNQEMPLALMIGLPHGPEQYLSSKPMVVKQHDVYSKKTAQLDVQKEEEELDPYITVTVCFCCKARRKRKKGFSMADFEAQAPPDLVAIAQAELIKAQEANVKYINETDRWKEKVRIAHERVARRTQKARELGVLNESGHDIDKFLGTKIEAEAPKEHGPVEIQFENFDEAIQLVGGRNVEDDEGGTFKRRTDRINTLVAAKAKAMHDRYG